MNLKEFTPPITAAIVSAQIKKQFGKDYHVDNCTLSESLWLLNKTTNLVNNFQLTENIHKSQNNAAYMKLVMLKEAASKQIAKLSENKGSSMKAPLISALKIVAMGGKLSESQLNSLKVSPGMKKVLENKTHARKFMRSIVESKKTKKALNESEIADAQNTLAAQDISDQIQGIIEKFADIKYKELPALNDSIRNTQGVDAAQEFNSSVTDSLDTLTSSLESAKSDVDNAVAVLTGQEISSGGDLDLDSMEGDGETDLGGDDDFDIDLDLDSDGNNDNEEGGDFNIELEPDAEEEVDLGRARRQSTTN